MARQPVTVHTSASYFSARRKAPGQPELRQKNGSKGATPLAVRPLAARDALPAAELLKAAEDWHLDCEYRLHSVETVRTRSTFLKNLAWFLEHRSHAACGTPELKEFFHYLRHGHEEPGGRWGKAQFNKTVRPETIKDYWVCFSTFFKWLVAEEVLDTSPMAKIPKPITRFEEKQPLTPAQVKVLLAAAKRSLHPRRDEAIVLLLLDTGIRSSELTGLEVKNIDLHARQCTVLGKGNKVRIVHFGVTTANALRLYLRQHRSSVDGLGSEMPLFLADKSGSLIRPLTRSGLQQLLERLALAAGIEGRSCSPHVLRRTFAVTWLRNGANVFSLQAMLGHSDLRMTQRYLSLARADIAEQARQFSPADNLRK